MISGCGTMPWQDKSSGNSEIYALEDGPGDEYSLLPDPGLMPSANQRFADVPLPADVSEDHERTYVYESSTLQIGRMVYTTKASVNEVAQFYIKECPLSDWSLENVIQADESVELLFVKASKQLRVTVQYLGRKLSMEKGGTLLIVHLIPENPLGPLD
jgi:hypothetical protein